MTTATHRGSSWRCVRRGGLSAVIVLIVSLSAIGCSAMLPTRNGAEQVANPLTDEQAKSQVVEPAKQIAQIAGLPGVFGSFDFGRCTPDGPPYHPPYRGVVDMSFTLPAGQQASAYLVRIATIMVAHGWAAGPLPGLNAVGQVINRDGVMAVMTADQKTTWGKVQLLGECRNIDGGGNAGRTNGSDVTDQLRQR